MSVANDASKFSIKIRRKCEIYFQSNTDIPRFTIKWVRVGLGRGQSKITFSFNKLLFSVSDNSLFFFFFMYIYIFFIEWSIHALTPSTRTRAVCIAGRYCSAAEIVRLSCKWKCWATSNYPNCDNQLSFGTWIKISSQAATAVGMIFFFLIWCDYVIRISFAAVLVVVVVRSFLIPRNLFT